MTRLLNKHEHFVLSALLSLKAFDSTSGVTPELICEALNVSKRNRPVHYALVDLAERGVIEFVLASGRVPLPGDEMRFKRRKYFKDLDEYADIEGFYQAERQER